MNVDPIRERRRFWARRAHELGWKLTPLNGKLPTTLGWTEAPPPTLEQHESWALSGNLGLRTGDADLASGVFVIDFDFPKLVLKIDVGEPDAQANYDAALALYASLPRTITVITGSGGEHKYFAMPAEPLGNSVAKLAPGVDTRGRGGQVVYPGSLHPETDREYEWAPGFSPDDVPLEALPPEILERLAPKQRAVAPPPARPLPAGDLTPYGKAALDKICAAIAGAPSGARNATLNSEAFGAFQLLAGGVDIRSATLVEQALFQAASACGLVADDGEAAVWSTIRSARRGGEASPREAPPRPEYDPRRGLRAVPSNQGGATHEVAEQNGAASTVHEAPGRPAGDAAPSDPPVQVAVLVPGSHKDRDEHISEIGNDDFVEAALLSVPEGTIYRRGDLPGEIVGEPGGMIFRTLTNERMRIILDQHLRLSQWTKRKIDPAPWLKYVTTSMDLSRLVLEAAVTHPSVRPLRHLVSYPVFLADLALAAPGWNDLGGVYYDCPPAFLSIELPDHPRARAILDDLVVDFPWKPDDPTTKQSASRENYFGLLLTPMLRAAIHGNVPMHMILSTTPGTGKTLLAETILGGVYLGKPTPARHLGSNEEERQKSIVALLRQGETIVHLDNLRDYLDSATISSLLTSTEFAARRLGVNESFPMPNDTILVTTGNNVKATQEIVRRSVPIWIIPTTDTPEARTDFRHPDLSAYVAEQRRDVLAALVSMVVRWRDGERPKGLVPKGSFDRWAEIVGGVLLFSGFAGWRSNERAWQRAADTAGEDLRTLADLWWGKHEGEKISTSQIFDLVEEAGVFPHVMKANERAGRVLSLSRSVLAKNVDAPIGRWFLRRIGGGSSSRYYLDGE